MNSRMLSAGVVLACLFTAGCATNRSEVTLAAATRSSAEVSVANEKTAVIRSVEDARAFQDAPSDPSIPSLGFGGEVSATKDVKSRAIGRKRNTFGKALGDVLLEGGQTVEGVVRDNLEAALADAGYRVIASDDPGVSGGTLMLDVRINEFWAWFQPGFWAIKLHARISTELAIEGRAPPADVTVHAEDSRQMATDGAWMEIVQNALVQYRKDAAMRLSAAGSAPVNREAPASTKRE